MKSNSPLCNARLFEDGLSFHITITYRRNIFLNSVHVSVATIGPRFRRFSISSLTIFPKNFFALSFPSKTNPMVVYNFHYNRTRLFSYSDEILICRPVRNVLLIMRDAGACGRPIGAVTVRLCRELQELRATCRRLFLFPPALFS